VRRFSLHILGLVALLAISVVIASDAWRGGQTFSAQASSLAQWEMPDQFCEPEQIIPSPVPPVMSDLSAAVEPLGTSDNFLSVSVVRLSPGECIGYHSHVDASILYVVSGTITYVSSEYIPPLSDTPIAGVEVRHGPPGEPWESGELLASGTPVVLNQDEWVSQNGITWHTYRAEGADGAVVAITSYSDDQGPLDPSVPTPTPTASAIGGCHGGCVGRGP
jgi:hypothetical protein